MGRLAAFLLACLSLLALQAQGDPVFRIKVTMSGRRDSASYTSHLEIGYAPCVIWTGGSGGWVGSPAEFLANAGGLAAIRPGMSLPFYAMTHAGSASGSDGSETSTASVMTTGLGRAHWTERDKYGQSQKDTDLEDRPDCRQAARFYRTAQGARIADFDLGYVAAGRGGGIGCADPYSLEIDGQQVAQFCSFELTNKELANWKQVRKQKTQTFSDGTATVTVTAELYAELEDPGEVEVEIEGYEDWIPRGNLEDEAQPGNTVKVTAKVQATGLPGEEADRTAEITFELTETSREPGVCLNWPTNPDLGKGDLRLRKDENGSLEVITQDTTLRTKGLVKEATLVVSAFDYAAWGVLKVTAKGKDGKELKVTYHKKQLSAIQLPKDEDRNRIADAWQKTKGVQGYPATWDEAEVAGQKHKGDGLTLFQKYRGLVVMGSGGRSYLQPEPRQKVHFVIDPDGLVDLGRLQAATGLRPFKVLKAWTKDRKVDIHADYAHGGGKFASLIRKDLSVVKEHEVPNDPEGKKTHTQMVDEARSQWGKSEAPMGEPWTPRTVDGIVIFSGRIHDKLRRIRDRMLDELRHPERPEYAEGVAWMAGLGMGAEEKEQARKKLEALTDQELWALVKPMEQWLAIHELCHGVGVNGHLKGGVEDEECDNRVPSCPMQYMTWQEKRRYLLLGELGGSGKLCSQAPHSCWKQVNPKN